MNHDLANRQDYLERTKFKYLFFIICVVLASINLAFAFETDRPDSDGPTNIYIRMFMIDVDDVNASEQRFSANFYYEAHWFDKRLAHAESDILTYPITAVWTPRLIIANQQRLWTTLPEIVTVDRQGNVTYRQRVWGHFSQPLKLHQFPFEHQTYTIRLVSAGYNLNEINIEIYEKDISGIADTFSLPDWEIIKWSMDNTPYAFTSGGKGTPSMSFTIFAKRHIGYYVLIYIIPLILIVFMSWIVFWIDIKETNTRVSIAVTSMLTLIAYRFVMVANLPKVSYITNLDYIILASTLLVFTTLVLTALLSLIIDREKLSLAKKINLNLRWVLPIIFILLMLYPIFD